MLKEKYIVYYNWDEIAVGASDEECNHHFEEFSNITDAVNAYNKLGTKSKQILKLVTWQTTVKDITEEHTE